MLLQHYSDRVEAPRRLAVVAQGEDIWALDYEPQTKLRRLVPTIRVIEYPATFSSFAIAQSVDKTGRARRFLIVQKLLRPVADIILELGIVVNRVLPVT